MPSGATVAQMTSQWCALDGETVAEFSLGVVSRGLVNGHMSNEGIRLNKQMVVVGGTKRIQRQLSVSGNSFLRRECVGPDNINATY